MLIIESLRLLLTFANPIALRIPEFECVTGANSSVMPMIKSMTAAQRICSQGQWLVTNLQVQKILYLIHMVHMGRTGGKKLISAPFEAWDYGPVEPNLYHRVKIFGDRPIKNIFLSEPDISGTPEAAIIDEGCQFVLSIKPSELVAMTHTEGGAWAKNYVAGAKGVVIPDKDILDEYNSRLQ
jgi:uncharacterized phage-associated protein